MAEQMMQRGEVPSESARLAHLFREMRASGHEDERVFETLEEDLDLAGFTQGETHEVFELMHESGLLCRSEAFGRVMDLLLEQKDIIIENLEDDANMCRVDGGAGFRTAMLEGFSGKDVDGAVKVVMTFEGDHLDSRHPIGRDSGLWETKPSTAAVSLSGRGSIRFEDIRMVSFRFPVRFFPKESLKESERDRFEDGQIDFVVRHYIQG